MFGFKSVDHKTYSKNFLKTVTIQFVYAEIEQISSKFNILEGVFSEQFPQKVNSPSEMVEIKFNQNSTPIVNKKVDTDTLLLKSEDGNRVLNINKNTLILTINGNVYSSFESVLKSLNNIEGFFEACGIQHIMRLSIRKLNIAEFNVSEGNPTEIMTLLLNNDLVGNLNYFPNSEKIVNNIQTLNYKDGDNILNLKYGLIIPPHLDQIGQVIFDIDLIESQKIESNQVLNKAKGINSVIFNIFSWLISDNTKKFLDEED